MESAVELKGRLRFGFTKSVPPDNVFLTQLPLVVIIIAFPYLVLLQTVETFCGYKDILNSFLTLKECYQPSEWERLSSCRPPAVGRLTPQSDDRMGWELRLVTNLANLGAESGDDTAGPSCSFLPAGHHAGVAPRQQQQQYQQRGSQGEGRAALPETAAEPATPWARRGGGTRAQ